MVAPPSTQGLPSTRSCSGRGRGRDLLFRGTREGPSLPGLRCRAVVVPSSLRTHTQTHHAAIVAGARHVPVGRTVLVECVPPRRDALRDSGDGTRLEGRLPRRHGWQPWRGARLRKVGYGSARISLADTRAPSTLRRARCGRTPPQVICHGVRSRFSTRASAREHSYN